MTLRTLLTIMFSMVLLWGCAGNLTRAGYDYRWTTPARVPVYLATKDFSYDIRGSLDPFRLDALNQEDKALDHAIAQWNAVLPGRVEFYRAGMETALTNVVPGVHVRFVSSVELTRGHPPEPEVGRSVLELIGVTNFYVADTDARVLGRATVAVVRGLSGVRLRQAVTHELGHALGLRGHVLSPTAVMRAVDGLWDGDVLTEADKRAIWAVYPEP